MQKFKDWSAHIVRRFWHCASSCRENEATSNEEALRVMKVSTVFLTFLNNFSHVLVYGLHTTR